MPLRTQTKNYIANIKASALTSNADGCELGAKVSGRGEAARVGVEVLVVTSCNALLSRQEVSAHIPYVLHLTNKNKYFVISVSRQLGG